MRTPITRLPVVRLPVLRRAGIGAALALAAALPLGAAPAVAGDGSDLPLLRPSLSEPAPSLAWSDPAPRLGTAVAIALPLTPRLDFTPRADITPRADFGAGRNLADPAGSVRSQRLRSAEATGSLPERAPPAAPPAVEPVKAWCGAGRVVGTGAGFCLVN